MDIIWGFTVLGNVVLCLTLLFRGHYIRYNWLFLSTIFSIFADAVFAYARLHDPFSYPSLFHVIYFLCIGFNLMIIWESFCLRNRRVQIPVELQLGIELIGFLCEKAQFLWTAYYIECGLRATNLLMIIFFVIIFSEEPSRYD